MRIELDGALLSPEDGVVLRKAPGHDQFDFAQVIMLHALTEDAGQQEEAPQNQAVHMAPLRYVGISQDFWAPVLPRGHIWHFRFLSSWGDAHYIGLDALHLFDASGCPPPKPRLHASPPDINVLPHVQARDRSITSVASTFAIIVNTNPLEKSQYVLLCQDDPRTLRKLMLPHYAGGKPPPLSSVCKPPADVWLTPWSLNSVNDLWVTFDEPVCDSHSIWLSSVPNVTTSMYTAPPLQVSLSLIRVLNYSKTPARGVKEFELLVDDALVYRGFLRGVAQEQDGGPSWQSIVFTDDPILVGHEVQLMSILLTVLSRSTSHKFAFAIGILMSKAAFRADSVHLLQWWHEQ